MNTSISGHGRYEIQIDLSEKAGAGPSETKTLIQQRQYDLLKKQVVEHLQGLSQQASSNAREHSDEYKPGSGWSFFIDGTRGAGKSTFLTWVRDHIENDVGGDLHFVDCIDPSRIERAEIMLLVILERLKQRVDRKLKGKQDQDSDASSGKWHRALKKVAGGLSLLGKDYHPLDGYDPDLFLDWGLERTGNSTHLRSNLHALLDTAREILGVKALMFAFDDADTDSTHGVAVLECIRKYLDAPIVMVLVTGDIELYSLLLRQHFAKTVAGDRRAAIDLQRKPAAKDRSAQYLRMIDHLEEQYLLKLFPIERRIQLRPLWSLHSEDVTIRFVYRRSANQPDGIQEEALPLIKAMIQQGMRVKSDADCEIYAEFILKQPIRSVLQVMRRCAPHLAAEATETQNDALWNRDLTEAMRSSLHALALTSLYKYSINTDGIAEGDLPALTEAIFDLCIQDGDIDTAMYLRPMSADRDIRTAFVSLSSEVPYFCSNKTHIAIRHLLRTNGSISIFGRFKRDSDQSGDPSRTKSDIDHSEKLQRTFKSYIGVGRNEDSLDWARRITALIAQPERSRTNVRRVHCGIIGLKQRFRGDPKGSITADSFIKKLKNEKPAFYYSMVSVVDKDPASYASIFNTLGLIEKLLSASKDRESIKATFDRYNQILTVSAPGIGPPEETALAHENSVQEENMPDEDDEHLSSTDAQQNIETESKIFKDIFEWRERSESNSTKVAPSSILLGKIWIRLYYSLTSAAEHSRSKKKFQELMEIYAGCVINSFLVEELDHHLASSQNNNHPNSRFSIDRNNPRTSPKVAIENMKAVDNASEVLPLTTIIATCPLIMGLIKKNADRIDAFKNFLPNNVDIEPLLCSGDDWDKMGKIIISNTKKTD